VTNRSIVVAAAQLGPIREAKPRSIAVQRMVRLMECAHQRGVELVVFPELALMTFFPLERRHRRCGVQPGDMADRCSGT
jgi:predicted amidohydrolase